MNNLKNMNELKRDIKEEIKTLHCDYDSAKSFYNKAHVKITSVQLKSDNDYIYYDGMVKIDLYSYNTLVMTIYKDIKRHLKDTYTLYNDIERDDLYTNTTMRHVRECLKQYFYNDDMIHYFNIYNYSKKIIFKNALWQ